MDKLLHNAIRNELDDTVVSFVDKSKGTDQNVFIITTQVHCLIGECASHIAIFITEAWQMCVEEPQKAR